MIVITVLLFGAVAAKTMSTTSGENANEEIHCYCNLPECVSTGYMCKSLGLGCFSDLQSFMDVDRADHGCLDLLPREKNIKCQNNPEEPGIGVQGMLLLCCREDMCNHVDSPESKTKLNDSTIRYIKHPGFSKESSIIPGSPGYNSQEVWFKAATIAVPICGALILLLLILMAVKILRSDPQGLPPKLWMKDGLVPQVDTNCGNGGVMGSKKMPLLFQQNDCSRYHPPPSSVGVGILHVNACAKDLNVRDKNEANAKLNTTSSATSSDLIDLHKASHRPCNLYQPLIVPSFPSIHRTNPNNLYNTASWPGGN